MSAREIAARTGLSVSNVRKSITRLKQKKFLSTAKNSFSCTEGGASYRLSKVGKAALQAETNDESKSKKFDAFFTSNLGTSDESDLGTNRDVSSSSSYNNNYKQTEEAESDPKKSSLQGKRTPRQLLETLQVRLIFESFGIGLNDLYPIARDWDGSLEEFAESVEHLIFYLRSEDASGIKSPKAWGLKQLRSGYYAAPANFISWEDRQAEAKLQSRKAQAERRRQARLQGLQVDFDLWLDALDTPARQRIFAAAGDIRPEFMTPPMKMQMLRQHFAQTHEVPEFVAADGQGEA